MATRTIEFGKIDGYGRGRKINLVEVEVSLKNNKNGFPVFSSSADVWNAKRSDLIMAGQTWEYIKTVPINNALFQEIKRYAKAYRLNYMHAGTAKQEEALKKAGLLNPKKYDYYKACEYLMKKGLYEVKLTPTEAKYNPQLAGKPYKYGHGWIYRPIPAKDLNRIKQIIERGY